MIDLSKGTTLMHRFSTAACGAGLLAIIAALAAGTSHADARGRMLSPAERGIVADVLRTHGDVRDLGSMDPRKPVRIGVMLKYRHEDELEALTIAQGDRRSPYYHKYLSIAQWNSYFAPDEGTYENVRRKLVRAGFRIEQTFRNRGMIRAVANAGTAERYFRTQFHQVSQTGRGFRYVNVTPALMPAELAGSVVSVAGLHSVVSMHFPIHFDHRGRHKAVPHRSYAVVAAVTPSPKPITTSTPGANPNPDPTESPDAPDADFANYMEYGPSIFADAYDYPVQHGYGGRGHTTASVIDSDYSDADANLEFSTFGIPRVQTATNAVRVCTDPNGACTICNPAQFTATCDNEGESSLDADTIMGLAPAANFYEYLVNTQDSLDDVDVDAAYERVVSDDIADAVNSSFGDCETDDPSGLYSNNYVAMEGAAEGITFSASAGDTGGTSCGLYAGNGTPQDEVNVSYPASAPYFTAVGGTTFNEILPGTSCTVGDCYTNEIAWMDGGGGVSVYEPQPAWQTSFVAQGTTTQVPGITAIIPAASSGRDVPDIAFTADPSDGCAEEIAYDGALEGVGGTSLSSPMWVAMQTSINQVQGSRNGLVNPRLYAIAAAEYQFPTNSAGTTGPQYTPGDYTFAFRDITLNNNIPYEAGPGFDLTTGIGSVLGWELAGTE
jgi:subtilase family serine protease